MVPRRWLVGLGFVCVVAAVANADGPSDERKKLEGTWIVDSATRNGKPADDWKEGRLVFAGDKVTFKGPTGDKALTYTVDPSKKPKTIDFAWGKKDASEAPWIAIYELDGDTSSLRLCIGPVDQRPTEFSDKKGLLVVLKDVVQGVIVSAKKLELKNKNDDIAQVLVGSVQHKDFVGTSEVMLIFTEKTKLEKVVDGKRQPAKFEDLKKDSKVEFSEYGGVTDSLPPMTDPNLVVILEAKK